MCIELEIDFFFIDQLFCFILKCCNVHLSTLFCKRFLVVINNDWIKNLPNANIVSNNKEEPALNRILIYLLFSIYSGWYSSCIISYIILRNTRIIRKIILILTSLMYWYCLPTSYFSKYVFLNRSGLLNSVENVEGGSGNLKINWLILWSDFTYKLITMIQ